MSSDQADEDGDFLDDEDIANSAPTTPATDALNTPEWPIGRVPAKRLTRSDRVRAYLKVGHSTRIGGARA